MKSILTLLAAIVALVALTIDLPNADRVAAEPTDAPQPQPRQAQPQIEVAFVLDTTGSMGGLIDAAKRKIWYIANEVIRAEPKPTVRIGLVGYRDKGDEYVTRVHDLTDNIDQVYADLQKFRAGGGGDGPENVNQGLHDAINKLKWSDDKNTLKIIYLVGDCPPHNEYQDVPTYQKLSTAAITQGIYINTILCGSNAETATIWKDIARRAEGRFAAIDQDGGAEHIATPYDAELAKLNRELTGTVVVYGSAERQAAATALNTAAADMPAEPDRAEAAAERAKYAAKSGRVGTADLVQAIEDGEVKLKDVKDKDLSPEMQKLSPQQRKQYIAEQQKKRKELNQKIVELSKKRDEHIRQAQAEQAKEGKRAGFDAEVVDALHEQAAKKNINYKK